MRLRAYIVLAAGILAGTALFWNADPEGDPDDAGRHDQRAGASNSSASDNGQSASSTTSATATQTAPPDRGQAFNCSANDFPFLMQDNHLSDAERIEQMRNRLYALTDVLAASSDFEHRLTAGLLKVSDSMPDAIDDLERLLQTMPDDPVLHWRLLDACDSRGNHPVCESGEAEARVIAAIGNNGEAWAKIAHYRIKRGDEAGGLQALLNASATAEFDNYWGLETELMFRSFAVETNRSVPERLIESIGLAVTFPQPELKLINQCRLRAGESPEWHRACLAYGQRKEADSRTVLGRGIGLGLQDAMHVLAGTPIDPSNHRHEKNSF